MASMWKTDSLPSSGYDVKYLEFSYIAGGDTKLNSHYQKV